MSRTLILALGVAASAHAADSSPVHPAWGSSVSHASGATAARPSGAARPSRLPSVLVNTSAPPRMRPRNGGRGGRDLTACVSTNPTYSYFSWDMTSNLALVGFVTLASTTGGTYNTYSDLQWFFTESTGVGIDVYLTDYNTYTNWQNYGTIASWYTYYSDTGGQSCSRRDTVTTPSPGGVSFAPISGGNELVIIVTCATGDTSGAVGCGGTGYWVQSSSTQNMYYEFGPWTGLAGGAECNSNYQCASGSCPNGNCCNANSAFECYNCDYLNNGQCVACYSPYSLYGGNCYASGVSHSHAPASPTPTASAPTRSATASPSVIPPCAFAVGTQVQRSASWSYGGEDGGAGSVGVVAALCLGESTTMASAGDSCAVNWPSNSPCGPGTAGSTCHCQHFYYLNSDLVGGPGAPCGVNADCSSAECGFGNCCGAAYAAHCIDCQSDTIGECIECNTGYVLSGGACVVAPATASQTASITQTPSGTATPTRSSTGTRTNTASNSGSPSNTPSSSATGSNTPSNSRTPSNTPSASHSGSNTRSSSATPTNTPSNTGSPSNTRSSSVTPTSTRSNSGTPTTSASTSRSSSATPTRSGTPSPSLSPSGSRNPSATATPTQSGTAFPAPSPGLATLTLGLGVGSTGVLSVNTGLGSAMALGVAGALTWGTTHNASAAVRFVAARDAATGVVWNQPVRRRQRRAQVSAPLPTVYMIFDVDIHNVALAPQYGSLSTAAAQTTLANKIGVALADTNGPLWNATLGPSVAAWVAASGGSPGAAQGSVSVAAVAVAAPYVPPPPAPFPIAGVAAAVVIVGVLLLAMYALMYRSDAFVARRPFLFFPFQGRIYRANLALLSRKRDDFQTQSHDLQAQIDLLTLQGKTLMQRANPDIAEATRIHFLLDDLRKQKVQTDELAAKLTSLMLKLKQEQNAASILVLQTQSNEIMDQYPALVSKALDQKDKSKRNTAAMQVVDAQLGVTELAATRKTLDDRTPAEMSKMKTTLASWQSGAVGGGGGPTGPVPVLASAVPPGYGTNNINSVPPPAPEPTPMMDNAMYRHAAPGQAGGYAHAHTQSGGAHGVVYRTGAV